MADKPKKAKGKLVGKKKAVKKAKPSAAPVDQGSGLNVESKPRATLSDFKSKHEKALSSFPRKKPETRAFADRPGSTTFYEPKYTHSLDALSIFADKTLSHYGKRAFNKAFQQRKRFQDNKDYAAMQSEAPKTEAPAFGPRETAKNPVESLRKGKKDDFVKMRTSKAKEAPSFQGAMKAGKEKKAANKGLLEGMAKGAKDFPGPKDEKKQMAAMDMTSKMAKAGKEVRDAQEKDTKKKARLKELGKYVQREVFNKGANAETDREAKIKRHKEYAAEQSAQPHAPAPAFGPRQSSSNAKSGGMGSIPGVNVTSPMAAKMSASAKSFTGPTASQKVIAGMSQAGQQAKAKKQNKMAAFGKGVAAKVKAASAAGKAKHDQKPGLNPMDYKGASMFKHLKHAFSEKGPIGKMVNRGANKYDKGFEKVVAPIEHGIKTGVKKAGSAIKSGAKGVYGAVTSPTAKGLAQAAFTHAGMAVMHGTNYPRVMAQHASQGPREFKPGWHGFTSPVERPKAEEGTDTRSERA